MESIPHEIWVKIFNYITLYKDLIQCQQVCRRWRHPAETAMFSIKDLLEIRSEKQLIALCNHLEKDPSRGKLISGLYVMFRNDRSSIHVERLVRLAFTPNIRRLFGTAFDTDKTYQLMDAIVKDSKVKFTRMQIVARYSSSQWYDRFLLNFTESIITLELRFINLSLSTNVFINQHLEKFVNVKALLFDVTPNLTIQKLESILNKCPSVNNLEVNIEYGSVPLPAFHQVTAWTDANVKTSQMELLCMNKWVLYRPDMVEYFVRKYPNAHEFVFGSCVVEFQNGEDNEEEEDDDEEEIRRITSNLYRSLAILKELHDYEIQIKLPPGVYLEDVVSRMQTEDNFIVIDHYYRTEQLLQARSKPRHLIELNL